MYLSGWMMRASIEVSNLRTSWVDDFMKKNPNLKGSFIAASMNDHAIKHFLPWYMPVVLPGEEREEAHSQLLLILTHPCYTVSGGSFFPQLQGHEAKGLVSRCRNGSPHQPNLRCLSRQYECWGTTFWWGWIVHVVAILKCKTIDLIYYNNGSHHWDLLPGTLGGCWRKTHFWTAKFLEL